jgi:3-deoxy-D-manno-octulosonate 8-phosphate phosphatase (KDO 8-P phosphatase)
MNDELYTRIFEDLGGEFVTSAFELHKKLNITRAFLFDWDGVFNTGTKGHGQTSLYSEVDSMGINMLRFAYWLKNKQMPLIAIITGENNLSAFQLAQREHFDAVYFHVNHKIEALSHLKQRHIIENEQVLFCFDDILDVSLAEVVGARFLVKRKSNPLFLNYAKKHQICDYITGSESGQHAVREICELVLGIEDVYDETISKRIAYSNEYQTYLKERNQIETLFFTKKDNEITQVNISGS